MRNKTVLLVDDDYNNVVLIEAVLQQHGYETEYASNGLEAIEHVIKNRPVLIVMDLSMPYMDGYDAAKRLRMRPEDRFIPMVALSAAHMGKTELQEVLSLFDAYLPKPLLLDSGSFIKKVEQLILKSYRLQQFHNQTHHK